MYCCFRFPKIQEVEISLDVMHCREANVKFLVLQQGMEGLEQGVAVLCPLFVFPFFSLWQQKGRI